MTSDIDVITGAPDPKGEREDSYIGFKSFASERTRPTSRKVEVKTQPIPQEE